MADKLNELIKKVKTDNGPGYNIINLSNNNKVTIKESKLTDFWRGYCELVSAGKDIYPGLAEIPTIPSPIQISGTIRYDGDFDGGLMTEDFIHDIVSSYFDVLITRLRFDKGTEHQKLKCIYFESSQYKENITRNGQNITVSCCDYRFQFPWICIDPNYHKKIIRPEVVSCLKNRNAISHLEAQPDSTWDEMLNGSSITDPVRLYGSDKSSNGKPMMVYNNIYHYNEDNDDKVEGEVDISNVFVIDEHTHIRDQYVDEKKLINDNEDIEFILPFVLSLAFYGQPTRIKDDEDEEEEMEELPPPTGKGDDEDTAIKLLPLISKETLNKRTCWYDIALALHKTFNGHRKGLLLWQDLTSKTNFDKKECETKWSEIETNHLSVKTIAWYAKQDQPEKYKIWHDGWCYPVLESAATQPTDVSVSKAFYRCFWLDFICFGRGDKNWYKFKTNKWEHCKDAIEILDTMSGDFIQRLEILRQEIGQKKLQTRDDTAKKLLEANIGKICVLIQKLEDDKYTSRVLRRACNFFHCKDFPEITDQNMEMIACKNCIFAIDENVKEVDGKIYAEGKVEIREGKPEDYITRDMPVSYPFGFTSESPQVKAYLKWVTQLIPDPSSRHEFRKYQASFLRGKNPDKKLGILVGQPSAGKSTLVRVWDRIFGGFCCKLPLNITEKNKNPEGASPASSRSRWARLMLLEELDGTSEVPASFIKKKTGDDKEYGRFLNDNGGDYEPASKLIFVLNKLPKVIGFDKAVRIRVLPFTFGSCWLPDAPDDPEEQARRKIFKADTRFDKKIPEMAKAMLWDMINYYPIYAREGIIETEEMKRVADEYQKENDIYLNFIDKKVQKMEGEHGGKALLEMYEAYEEFRPFYRIENPKRDMIGRTEFKADMVNKLGPMDEKKNGWPGYQLKAK